MALLTGLHPHFILDTVQTLSCATSSLCHCRPSPLFIFVAHFLRLGWLLWWAHLRRLLLKFKHSQSHSHISAHSAEPLEFNQRDLCCRCPASCLRTRLPPLMHWGSLSHGAARVRALVRLHVQFCEKWVSFGKVDETGDFVIKGYQDTDAFYYSFDYWAILLSASYDYIRLQSWFKMSQRVLVNKHVFFYLLTLIQKKKDNSKIKFPLINCKTGKKATSEENVRYMDVILWSNFGLLKCAI